MRIQRRIGKDIFGVVVALLFMGSFSLRAQDTTRTYSLPQGMQQDQLVPGEIIVKLKAQSSSSARTASKQDVWERVAESYSLTQIKKAFPSQGNTSGRTAAPQVSLDEIYKVSVSDDENVVEVINAFLSNEEVEYAEPRFRYHTLLAPSDPAADITDGQQTYLNLVKAYEAWGISTGDSTIVIGIVDTGVDLDHEDLKDKIAYNYDDPVNGVDDDGDGYTDNYYGWDMSNWDNDPTADNDLHGIKVSGVCAASTNNETGIAGTGWNTKFLPVKISESNSGYLSNEYEGVLYAAQHGCKVINLSWGAAGANSLYGKDIIDYVVLDLDVVVIAAAGNTHDDLDYYPASYDNVLSVGASNSSDELASWATYSYKIDILAPGESIFTTNNGDSYGYATGSSFASPMVAGAAALVRQVFPDYSARQVMQQLRTTSYDISETGSNPSYEGQIGSGRLDMYQALLQSSTPAIRKTDMIVQSPLGEYILPGDTIEVYLKIENFLQEAQNLSISLSEASGALQFLSNDWQVGTLASDAATDNVSEPFTLVVSDTVSRFSKIPVKINYTANDYEDFEYIFLYVEEDYLTLEAGDLQITASSKGDIGFNKSFYVDGDGIRYKGDYIALNAGFMVGNSTSVLKDNAPRYLRYGFKEDDFEYSELIGLVDDTHASLEAQSRFVEESEDLGVEVRQRILQWDEADPYDLMVFEYTITNLKEQKLSDLASGLFVDWDLNTKRQNAAAWNSDGYGYVYDKSNLNKYAAIVPLSDLKTSFYAMDIGSYYGNSADFSFFFEDDLKYEYLSGGIGKSNAGVNGLGNDVGITTGYYDQDIAPKGQLKIAFVILAADSEEEMAAAREMGIQLYQQYLLNPPLWYAITECSGQKATIDPDGDAIYEFYQDPLLQTRLDSAKSFTSGILLQDTAFYLVEIEDGFRGDVQKVEVLLRDPVADFELSKDTLLLVSGESSLLTISNTSLNSDTYFWDFGNGKKSYQESPEVVFNKAGTYSIRLQASAEYGCIDSTAKTLVVALRSDAPEIAAVETCAWQTISLQASNTSSIAVYTNANTEPIFEGDVFETKVANRDTSFWVENTAGKYPSKKVKVQITVDAPQVQFEYHIDTLDLSLSQGMFMQINSNTAVSYEWYINNSNVSNASQLVYDYQDETAIEGYVITTADNGCYDSLGFNMGLYESVKPDDVDSDICIDHSVSVSAGANLYAVYSDTDMQDLIYKGSCFKSEPIISDTTFYVSNLSNGLESTTATYTYTLKSLKAVIQSGTESTILKSGSATIALSDVSTGNSWSYWILTSGELDSASSIQQKVTKSGTYTYLLIAGDDENCIDSTSYAVTISNVSGVENEEEQWRLYPNPADEYVSLSLGTQAIHWKLVGTSGEVIDSGKLNSAQKELKLYLESLKSGIYLLLVSDKQQTRGFKLFKK